MPYSDFTLKRAREELAVVLHEEAGIFAGLAPVPISDHLRVTLAENVPIAVSVNTEKARSEFIVSNILVELRKKFDRRISLFSGVEFNVDRERNLNGFCDFLISDSPEQLILTAPLVAVVEAKNENIPGGLGQCVAEMVAARIFNRQEQGVDHAVYGVVTTGTAWRFLKLDESKVSIDLNDYFIDRPELILGILAAMVELRA